MSDKIEVIPVLIPCASYEKQIQSLIAKLLEVDEKLFPAEVMPDEKEWANPTQEAV
jgi:hypothetical protein